MAASVRINRGVSRLAMFSGLLLLLACAFAMPRTNAAGQDVEATLSGLVSAGVVENSLASAAINDGPIEAMVQYNDISVSKAAGFERQRLGLTEDSPAIIAQRANGLMTLKENVQEASGDGVTVLRDYANFGIQYVRFDSAAALAEFASNPAVSRVVPNETYRPQFLQSLPLIEQPRAQVSGFTGEGVAVAVLDTGVDYLQPHFGCTGVATPATTCRVVEVVEVAEEDDSRDDNGHGTNVAGIVSAVAPGAKIIGYDIFDTQLSADDVAAVAALDLIVTNQAVHNIRAVNLSIGNSDHEVTHCDSLYTTVFASLRGAGIIPVVAAGNDGSVDDVFVPGLSDPGCSAGALSVGAVYDSRIEEGAPGWGGCENLDADNNTDQVTCFSQSAPILGMLAPGAKINSAGLEEGGTSQATPHVSGAVAVLASAVPGQTAAQREASLTSSGPLILDVRNGLSRHRLDLCAALANAGSPCGIPNAEANDDRAGAFFVSEMPYLARQSTAIFSTQPSDPMPTGCPTLSSSQHSGSAWWSFTTGTAGTYTVNTVNSDYPLADEDTALALYSYDGENLTEVGCNDDGVVNASAQLSMALTAGTTYYLEVMGYGSGGGGYLVLNMDYSGTLVAPTTTQVGWDVQPNSIAANMPMLLQIAVSAQTAGGVRNTEDSATSISLSMLPGGPPSAAVFSCVEPLTQVVTDGVAIWTNCTVDIPYFSQFRLQAESTSPASVALSDYFAVTDPAYDATCDGTFDATDALAALRQLSGFTDGLLPQAPCTGNPDGGQLTIEDIRELRLTLAIPT